MTTDKPSQDPPRPAGASIESLREDLRQMFAAAMHHGACWEIGWTAEAAEPRLRAVLTELESLRAERDALLKGEHLLFSQRHLPVVIAERDALRAQVAALTEALGKAEEALESCIYTRDCDDMTEEEWCPSCGEILKATNMKRERRVYSHADDCKLDSALAAIARATGAASEASTPPAPRLEGE